MDLPPNGVLFFDGGWGAILLKLESEKEHIRVKFGVGLTLPGGAWHPSLWKVRSYEGLHPATQSAMVTSSSPLILKLVLRSPSASGPH